MFYVRFKKRLKNSKKRTPTIFLKKLNRKEAEGCVKFNRKEAKCGLLLKIEKAHLTVADCRQR
jgi:hypothetical protein